MKINIEAVAEIKAGAQEKLVLYVKVEVYRSKSLMVERYKDFPMS